MSVLREIAVFLCGFIMMRSCDAQYVSFGKCPEVQSMQDFNITRYLGRWHVAKKYFVLLEVGGKCITIDYAQKEDDEDVINVVTKQLSIYSGYTSELRGQGTFVHNPDEAHFTVSFPSLLLDYSGPYRVVDTDYDNYAVVWACSILGTFYNLGFIHSKNAWILTREVNPSGPLLEKALEVVERNGISKTLFSTTDQNDCPEDLS